MSTKSSRNPTPRPRRNAAGAEAKKGMLYGPGREKADEPGWTQTPQTLRVEGGENAVQVQPVQQRMLPTESLAKALLELHNLGINMHPTEALKGPDSENGEGEDGNIDVPTDG